MNCLRRMIFDTCLSSVLVRDWIGNVVLAPYSKSFGSLMRMASSIEIEMHKICASQLFFDEWRKFNSSKKNSRQTTPKIAAKVANQTLHLGLVCVSGLHARGQQCDAVGSVARWRHTSCWVFRIEARRMCGLLSLQAQCQSRNRCSCHALGS